MSSGQKENRNSVLGARYHFQQVRTSQGKRCRNVVKEISEMGPKNILCPDDSYKKRRQRREEEEKQLKGPLKVTGYTFTSFYLSTFAESERADSSYTGYLGE
ncbi:hypothetical protein TNCT_639241 [Trichonephila clavata]|uniref:Uncharacterized protein n=1 Tax=Trichonephila clavata TaxID=2740835 RepID=A0A8X6IRJ3_TRICU|nr:hypothetical protein TNCT_639241 [Trichonephila clavata]